MATFNEILQYTMFSQAGRDATFETIGLKPFPAPKSRGGQVSDSSARFMPIWHFEHDADSAPDVVRNLTCISRGMGNGRMTVCDEIKYEDVKVVTTKGKTIALPLRPEFVIQKGYLKTGRILEGQHFLYPLPAEIDSSMLVTFGYEFKGGPDAVPVKIADAVLDQPSFMPAPGSEPLPTVGEGQALTLIVAPLRIIVCISLTTAKERADFEPGELLGAGRVWPHVMVMANQRLNEVHATVHVKRPAQMKMDGGDHSTHAEMNPGIESSLFADNNRKVLMADIPGLRDIVVGSDLPIPLLSLPSPYWDDLFDAVEVGFRTGRIRAVDPMERGGTIIDPIDDLEFGGESYARRSIERTARQGAFDNLHCAPTMKSAARPDGFAAYHLDKIYMAPFCEHDCLHTHWRWGKPSSTKVSTKGWTGRGGDGRVVGEPYKAVGAPMVPAHQLVEIEATGPSSFKYIASAVGTVPGNPSATIASGTWSIFFHHGMAYSLSLNSVLIRGLDASIDALSVLRDEPSLSLDPRIGTASASSAARYWRLRWGGNAKFLAADVVNERLKVADRSKVLGRTSP